MSTVYLTQAISNVYLVHPDELPGEDEQLVKEAIISKTNVKELTDANGQEWYLLENEGTKDLLNHQKVPVGLIKKEDAQVVSAHNWAAFGFKTKDIASNKFVFHDAENELFKEICKELNDDDESKYAPKPDIPGMARLLHDPENHFKLSRWVYKHASEWAGEDSYKAEVKEFLEKNAKDTDEAKEMARRKYDRLEAKIANLAWWKEVSQKVKDFPASPVVYHFNPTAFLEQMRRVEGVRDIDLRPNMIFENQKGNSDCNITCKRIMKQMGVIPFQHRSHTLPLNKNKRYHPFEMPIIVVS